MTKVINGKQYNTDTAKRLGKWDNGKSLNDFAYCDETLYRTKSGNYFLHGAGGAMSRYASSRGNNTGWGEQIIPMTYDQAANWAEENLSSEEYIAAFGEPDEDGRAYIVISADVKKKLDEMQSKTGRKQTSLVEELILKAYLDRYFNK